MSFGVLVTGGAGHVGRHVVAELVRPGHNVIDSGRRVTGRTVPAIVATVWQWKRAFLQEYAMQRTADV